MVKIPVSKKTMEAINKIYFIIDDILSPVSLTEDRKLPLIMDFIATTESSTEAKVIRATDSSENDDDKSTINLDVYPLYRLRLLRDDIRKKNKDFTVNLNDVLGMIIDDIFEKPDEFVGYLELLRHEAIKTKE